jgi:type IV pilus assembly protein PilA
VTKIKNRLSSEQGFTLIELLVVIVILGILVAIAVPSYLSFRGNASQAAAQANVRSAIPAAEGYYQDPTFGNGTYYHLGLAASGTMLPADLAAVAPGVSPGVTVMTINGGQGYCLGDVNGTKKAYYVGGTPGALPTSPVAAVQSTVTTGYTCSDFTGWAA